MLIFALRGAELAHRQVFENQKTWSVKQFRSYPLLSFRTEKSEERKPRTNFSFLFVARARELDVQTQTAAGRRASMRNAIRMLDSREMILIDHTWHWSCLHPPRHCIYCSHYHRYAKLRRLPQQPCSLRTPRRHSMWRRELQQGCEQPCALYENVRSILNHARQDWSSDFPNKSEVLPCARQCVQRRT